MHVNTKSASQQKRFRVHVRHSSISIVHSKLEKASRNAPLPRPVRRGAFEKTRSSNAEEAQTREKIDTLNEGSVEISDRKWGTESKG